MRCAHQAYLVPAAYQDQRGELTMQAIAREDAVPIAIGVPGLDDILAGGYAANRAHLVEGRPGSGKTTLGLHFLLDGLRQEERCLYTCQATPRFTRYGDTDVYEGHDDRPRRAQTARVYGRSDRPRGGV